MTGRKRLLFLTTCSVLGTASVAVSVLALLQENVTAATTGRTVGDGNACPAPQFHEGNDGTAIAPLGAIAPTGAG